MRSEVFSGTISMSLWGNPNYCLKGLSLKCFIFRRTESALNVIPSWNVTSRRNVNLLQHHIAPFIVVTWSY